TSQRVEMDEAPAIALRTKKDSSMRVAINLVKEGKAEACVSAGNTGALMATARFVLKTLPGIDRPAIISTFPTRVGTKNMRMLDLGANVDCTADHLFQFAVMGSVLASAVDKGNEQVKATAALLANATVINYMGYIEGNKIYDGKADVIVCDGFVGNIALKTTEGVASFIKQLIKEAFYKNLFSKFIALLALPVIKSLTKRIDPDRYNGASFIGLKGIVVKSHGSAKIQAFACAIEEAIVQVEKDVTELMSRRVEALLKSYKS
ncbi:MAG: plsX, partial [Gammaproteobacteria bacterium]|nr:plsX [Gammaproteobacteria bacterium]